jgi:Protein of unknown function (DUF4013)
MNHAAETNSRRPVGRAVPILGDPETEPMEVVAAEPLQVLRPEPLEAIAAEPLVVEPASPPYAEFAVPEAARHSNKFLRTLWAIGAGVEWLFGLVVIPFGLAFLSSIPILNLLSFGYLLESAGRVGRSGRLRDGFVGVRLAARLGLIVFIYWFVAIFEFGPLQILAGFAKSAQIIDPGSVMAARWRVGLLVVICLWFIHFASACALGGKLRHFLSPFNLVWLLVRIVQGGYYTKARDAVWDTLVALRLPYYFWLGLRGLVGSFAWLFVPITLLVLSHAASGPLGNALGIFGALLLTLVLLYLPILQMRFATTNNFAEAFNIAEARRDYRRAPWAFTFAFIITLLSALPLYLLKIQIVPREAEWLPSLFFILFIFPAKMLTGWAMGRANRLAARRPEPRHWFFRITGRLPLLPVAGFYVLIVFFTKFLSWHGVWSLYEQHAFLLPVPFFTL